MRLGCHGLGVLDKTVPIEHSHGLTEAVRPWHPIPILKMAITLVVCCDSIACPVR